MDHINLWSHSVIIQVFICLINRGGSPRGVKEPPILATKKIK